MTKIIDNFDSELNVKAICPNTNKQISIALALKDANGSYRETRFEAKLEWEFDCPSCGEKHIILHEFLPRVY